MSELGRFALLLGLFLSGYAILVELLGSWRKDVGLTKSARNATVAYFLCLSVAMAALWVLLVRSDFSVKYVVENTSRALPLPYKISALWAGAAGSLLLWFWIQAGFVVLAYCKSESSHRSFAAGARIVANLVSVFFFVILVFDRHPFEPTGRFVQDGADLNPLLQHPAMVLHPPILFVGYAGFLIPFAWAFSRLKANPQQDAHEQMFDQARNWAILAWLFLTAGIMLGAWWAYEELGWGGYWAWDPVENASLMPWLIGTALVHCLRTYKRSSSIATWTVILSLVTFSLCVFGRFLTKYGSRLFESVHTFGDPGLGILYLVLLVHVWVIVAVLLIRNHLHNKRSDPVPPAKASRFVVFGNWLLIVLTFVIFVGTMFPFFSKVFFRAAAHLLSSNRIPDKPISLAPEFFTKITAPGGILLLLLVGLCPHLLAHGLKRHWRTILAGLAILAGMAAWLWSCSLDRPLPPNVSGAAGWIGQWLLSASPAIPVFIFCALILVNLLADFIGYEKRLRRAKDSGRTPRRSLRWYGARVVHMGVALAFIGMAGSGGFDIEKKVALRPGMTAEIPKYASSLRDTAQHDQPSEQNNAAHGPKYTLTFEKLTAEHGPNFVAVAAHILIHDGENLIARLKPSRAVYTASNKEVSEVDIRRTLASDLYLAVTAFDPSRNLINLRIMVKPLINWIWIGSIVAVVGTLLVLVSRYTPNESPARNRRKDSR